VVHVADGETALTSFGDGAESAPDIVVLDWMLPGIDGLECCGGCAAFGTARC